MATETRPGAGGLEDAGPASLDALFAPQPDRRIRRLPGLVAASLRLTWRAGRREFTASGLLQMVSGMAVAVQLLLARRLLEVVVGGSGFGAAAPSLLGMAVVGAVVAFASLARQEQQRVLTELVGRHAIDRVLDVTTAVDLVTYEQQAFHHRMQRAVVNAEIRPYQVASGVLGAVSALFAIAGIAAALLLIAPLFLGVVLLAYVPAWIASARASRLAHRFSVAQTERDRRRLYLRQVLCGRDEAKEVRAFDLAGVLRARYDALYEATLADLRAMARRRLTLGFAGGLATALLTAAAVALLVWMVTTGRAEVASAAAAAGAVLLLGTRLQTLTASVGALYESSLFLEDFTSFVAAVPDTGRPARPRPADRPVAPFGRLELRGVGFSYPTRPGPSLQGVSAVIDAGEVVALVGPNGSGKTTLAKLLAGLYHPTEGAILWDGVDAASLDPVALRANVAVIFQDFVRYALTAAENIGLGRHGRMDDEAAVVAAARRAGADEFLRLMPRGYGTRLGPEYFGGSDLSVGQWQRVALARAVFRDAPFLVLDEPTAALDPLAERALFDGIRDLAGGRTVLLVSHRFSSVRSADRILVLSGGELVEQGTHDALLALGGLYAEMFEIQAGAYGHAWG